MHRCVPSAPSWEVGARQQGLGGRCRGAETQQHGDKQSCSPAAGNPDGRSSPRRKEALATPLPCPSRPASQTASIPAQLFSSRETFLTFRNRVGTFPDGATSILVTGSHPKSGSLWLVPSMLGLPSEHTSGVAQPQRWGEAGTLPVSCRTPQSGAQTCTQIKGSLRYGGIISEAVNVDIRGQ